MKDCYHDFDHCCEPDPCKPEHCEPCRPGPCGTPVPPPVRPVVNIPGPNVQAQMCEMAGRVNECILRWNQTQRNCYEALDRVVGAAPMMCIMIGTRLAWKAVTLKTIVAPTMLST